MNPYCICLCNISAYIYVVSTIAVSHAGDKVAVMCLNGLEKTADGCCGRFQGGETSLSE
jgi:hypothetical protein